eukprot:1157619-Pelagomonas_calceolata.AAC.26
MVSPSCTACRSTIPSLSNLRIDRDMISTSSARMQSHGQRLKREVCCRSWWQAQTSHKLGVWSDGRTTFEGIGEKIKLARGIDVASALAIEHCSREHKQGQHRFAKGRFDLPALSIHPRSNNLPGYSNLKIFRSGRSGGGSMNFLVQYILYRMKA